MNEDHPVRFSVDYPDRALDRLTTAFRIFTVIPIAIVLASIGGYTGGGGYDGGDAPTIAIGGTGLLFLPPLLMIVFREKYPRWWYDWNLELLRFINETNEKERFRVAFSVGRCDLAGVLHAAIGSCYAARVRSAAPIGWRLTSTAVQMAWKVDFRAPR